MKKTFLCTWCETNKPAKDFGKTQLAQAKKSTIEKTYAAHCKHCKRMYDILRKYNVTTKEYYQLLADQKNCCAICEKELLSGDLKKVHLDHDHSNNKVRGVLCMQCNTGIGKFKDSPETLTRAAQYITKHRAVVTEEEVEILTKQFNSLLALAKSKTPSPKETKGGNSRREPPKSPTKTIKKKTISNKNNNTPPSTSEESDRSD